MCFFTQKQKRIVIMSHYKFKLFLFFLILSSLACSQTIPLLTETGATGMIVYYTDQDGTYEIYAIDPNSGESTRLTNNASNDISPAFIPVADHIGFVSDREPGWNLYAIDKLGDNEETITADGTLVLDYPNWSPDGKFIAVSMAQGCKPPATNCYYDIFTMNADGTGIKQLTDTPQPASEWVPVWSPDGGKIAFASDRDGDSEVYVMNRDGSNLKQLTDNSGYDGNPSWSPDGKTIVFDTDRDGVSDWDLYFMDANGANLRAITSNTTNDFDASFSPDGNWLVYLTDRDGDNEIVIIDINGENQKRLTQNTFKDIAPIWIP